MSGDITHRPGSAGATRTLTGCCVSTSPKAHYLSFNGPGILATVADELNRRPRMTLDWGTPAGRLGGSGISKSEVSRICQGLNEAVGAFRTRRLDHTEFPYLFLDATYVHVRTDGPGGGQVTSKAVVIATGVTADGRREILGLDVGDSEDEVFWRAFLTGLKKRGLGGVRLVISDQHAGLVAALRRAFQGAAHHRCRVHFIRSLLAHVPKAQVDMVAAVFRTIFAQPDPDSMATTWEQVRDQLAARFPKIGPVDGRREGRGPGLQRLPPGALAQDLVDQPARAAQQGGQTPLPGRRHLPQRSRRHPLGRRRPSRHQRRMGNRRTPLPLRGLHGAALPRPRYWTRRRDQQRRLGIEDHLKAHHSPGLRRTEP